MSFQQITLVGNLGSDPEMKYMPDGTAVTNFPVATSRRWTNAEGEGQEQTIWFRIEAWGRQAENCNQYLQKGRQVMVVGTVKEPYAYINNDTGEAGASLQVRAQNVQFLGGGNAGSNGYVAPEETPVAAGAAQETDDIPF